MEIPRLEELHFLENDGMKYCGLAFDGCRFYLTSKDTIHIFDQRMRRQGLVETCRCFTSICYDPCMGCFWAISGGSQRYAYRLDRMLKEVDKISIPFPSHVKVTGIACGDRPDELLLSAGDCLYRAPKSGGGPLREIRRLPGALFLNAITNDQSCIYTVWYDYGCVLRRTSSHASSCTVILPEGYVPVDLEWGHGCQESYLLAVKDRCYYRIIRICSDGNHGCDPCHEPVYDPCHDPCDPCCDPCDPGCDPCGPCDPCCDPCDPCRPPRPCEDPCKRPGREQGVTDVIESVALIETALSHILNAEGEKLQKILELTDQPDVLLEVNKSISGTISNVTHLEYVLFEKLRLAHEMCGHEQCKPKDHGYKECWD